MGGIFGGQLQSKVMLAAAGKEAAAIYTIEDRRKTPCQTFKTNRTNSTREQELHRRWRCFEGNTSSLGEPQQWLKQCESAPGPLNPKSTETHHAETVQREHPLSTKQKMISIIL